MNTDVLAGKWNQVRGDLQRWWGKLSEDDIEQLKGNVDRLAGLVQEKYGYTRERAEQEVDRFLDQYNRNVYAIVRNVPGNVRQTVARYPWAAVATGLGLAFVVGLLLKPNR